jgi:hypothetical protein
MHQNTFLPWIFEIFTSSVLIVLSVAALICDRLSVIPARCPQIKLGPFSTSHPVGLLNAFPDVYRRWQLENKTGAE